MAVELPVRGRRGPNDPRGSREEQKVQRRRRAALCYHLYQQGLSLQEVALRTGYATPGIVQKVIIDTFGPAALTGIELSAGVDASDVLEIPKELEAAAEAEEDSGFFLPDDLGPVRPGTQPRELLPRLDQLLAGWEAFARTGAVPAAKEESPPKDDEWLAQEREYLEWSWSRWLTTLFPAVFSGRTGVPLQKPFAKHHEEFWDWVWALRLGEPVDPFVAIWSRGGGKCLAAATEIACADGSRRRIADIGVGERVLSFHEASGRLVLDHVIAKVHSGLKPCLRLRTKSGKELLLTAEHRVRTLSGWVQAGTLLPGDRIASPRRLPTESLDARRDEEVRLLAYMLAEGATTSENCTFTNADSVVIEDFKRCVGAMGFTVRTRAGTITHGLSGGARAWVRSQPGLGVRSHEKRVPPWVFGLPDRQKWAFLAAFVDTDGWVTSGRRVRLGVTLASRGLVEDIAHLFLQVGVFGTIRPKPNPKRGAWEFMVDQGCLVACAEHLPLRLKGGRLARAATAGSYSLLDTYPASVRLVPEYGVLSRLRRRHGTALGPQYAITRGTLRKAISANPAARWEWLEAADVFWDAVVSVTPDGEHDTYDIEVLRNHSFVANGLLSHNSTGAELACVAAAARGTRRYGLYVSRTQDQADGHVAAVASHLESSEFGRLYPNVADRAVGKYGFSRGWRHNRLSCGNGFTLDALGLDKSVRGVKVDSDRPDFIVLDDIDSDTDSDMMVERQINKLARRVLPTAGADAAVLFVQNLVHGRSLAARLVLPFGGNGGPIEPADILHQRRVSGPHPALEDFAYEQNPLTGRYFISSGEATWAGQDKESCQRFIDRYGITAFRVECQHEDVAPENGLFAKVLFRRVQQTQLPPLHRIVCWIDPSVTDKDSSDSCGIQIAALGDDNMVYSLWSWERRSSPQAVLRLALEQALFYRATTVGVETDQGGDLWRTAYDDAVNELIAERGSDLPYPVFREQKAGAGHGPKAHRASLMLTDYERGRIVHVVGTHDALESALRRFPVRKPYDLVDAAYWAWNDLRAGSGAGVHFW